jgi:hypothetical protein
MRHEAYGKISAKALAVLTALLWRFHNAATGKCFPVIRGDHRGFQAKSSGWDGNRMFLEGEFLKCQYARADG